MAFFLMQCWHHPNQDDARNAARPTHREWVQSGGNGLASVLIGAAMLDEEGQGAGHFGVLEADTAQRALKFAEGDPFNTQGIVEKIRIIPLPDTFQAHRISERMSS